MCVWVRLWRLLQREQPKLRGVCSGFLNGVYERTVADGMLRVPRWLLLESIHEWGLHTLRYWLHFTLRLAMLYALIVQVRQRQPRCVCERFMTVVSLSRLSIHASKTSLGTIYHHTSGCMSVRIGAGGQEWGPPRRISIMRMAGWSERT